MTVAQALHWFDVGAFYAEAARVLRADGVLAIWCYQLTSVTPAIDAIIEGYYEDTVGDFWPPERRHIERGYDDIAPAWPAIPAPGFEMRCNWTADAMLGYLGSWSATMRAATATGTDPLASIRASLRDAWGDMRRPVRWPLVCRVFSRPSER